MVRNIYSTMDYGKYW